MKKIIISFISIITISATIVASHYKASKSKSLTDKELNEIIDSLCKNELPQTADTYFMEAKLRAHARKDTRWLLNLIDKQIDANLVRFEYDDAKILDMLAKDTINTWTPYEQLLKYRLIGFRDELKWSSSKRFIELKKVCTTDSIFLMKHSATEVVDSSELICDMSIYDYIAMSILKLNDASERETKDFRNNWIKLAKKHGSKNSQIISILYNISTADYKEIPQIIENVHALATTNETKGICAYFLARYYEEKASTIVENKADNKRINEINSYLDSAIIYYEQAKVLHERFYDQARFTIADINRKEMNIKTEDFIAPNTFVPIYINAHNVNHITLRVYDDKDFLCAKDYWEGRDGDNLSKLKMVDEISIDLPILYSKLKSAEYYYETKGQPVGHYLIVAFDNESNKPLAVCRFHSTKMDLQTYTTSKNKYVQVCDRQSGAPLSGVKIKAKSTKNLDENGWGEWDKGETLIYGNDTIRWHDSFWKSEGTNSTITNGRIITDRAIYRPGQTLYFKAYAYQANCEKKWSIAEGNSLRIEFNAANGSKIAQKTLKTNKYGSISGSFEIPLDVYKGTASLYIYQNNRYLSSASVNIEEYKRSNNSLSFEPITQPYLMGDSIFITGIAKSADGNQLANAEAHFNVSINYKDELLVDSTCRTDNDGKFVVKFLSNKNYNKYYDYVVYNIKAYVIDLSGEKVEASTSCLLTKSGSKLDISHSETYTNTEDIDIELYSTNSNEEPFATNGIVKIKSVENVNKFLPQCDNYWTPDSILSSKHSIAFGDMNVKYKTIDNVVYNQKIEIDKSGNYKLTIPRGTLQTGLYQIEFEAVAANGEVISTDTNFNRRFSIVANNQKCKMLPELYLKMPNKLSFGQTLDITIGSKLENANILVVMAYGNDIIYKKFHTCSESTKTITLQTPSKPSALMHNNIDIVISCTKDNRNYSKSSTIQLIEREEPIDIKISTSHDKSTPGATETWTLTIQNPKPTEIVASMYDTRLDKIRKSYWNTDFYKPTNTTRLSHTNRISFIQRRIGRCSLETSYHKYRHRAQDFLSTKNWLTFGTMNAPENLYNGYKSIASIGYGTQKKRLFNRNKNAIADLMFDDIEEMAEKQSAVPIVFAQETDVAAPPSPIETEPKEQVREDFRETVFFYPDLTPDIEGHCTFSFTLPDNITTYRFRALAHDTDMRSNYITKDLSVSKMLTASLGLPRFATEGDTIVVCGTITSNDKVVRNATCSLSIIDTLTNAEINQFDKQKVDLSKIRSQQVSWKVIVPQQCSALKFKLTAQSDNISDAELNTIIVEPRNIEVAESESFVLMAKGTHDIVNPFDNGTTISLSFNYTSNTFMEVLKALPHINQEYYPSSDTYLGMLESSAIAIYLKNKIDVKKALDTFRANDSLLNEALTKNTKSMPWLYTTNRMNRHNRNVIEMLSSNNASRQYDKALSKLNNIQNSDGSFPWFNGMEGSEYLTSTILATIGWMARYNLINTSNPKITSICNKGKKYLTNKISEQYSEYKKDSIFNYISLYTLYAYTYLTTTNMSDDAKALINQIEERWTKFDITERIMATSILWRTGNHKKAELISQSLSENIVDVDEYCAHISNYGIYWYNSTLLSQAMLIMTLNEIRPKDEATQKLTNWLIMQKRSQHWSDTQATSRAVMALLSQSADMSCNDTVKIEQNQWICTTSSPTMSTSLNPNDKHPKATITKDKNIPSWGAWQRVVASPIDELKAHHGENLTLERIIEVKHGNNYLPIDKETLKVGDKIRITLKVTCNVDLDFVRIRDLRAACLEPNDQLSHYIWHWYSFKPAHYYSPSYTDVSFFISRLRRGEYQFDYTTTIRQSGTMSVGYAEAECIYCPDIKAHSEGRRITIK